MSDLTASQIVSEAKHDSVTRDRLTQTGKGGLISAKGFLRDLPLISYFNSNELPHYILSNVSKGLTINKHGDENIYKCFGGYKSFAAITNTRILIVVPCESRDRNWNINYSSIKNVNIDEGITKNKITIIEKEAEYIFYFAPGDFASDEIIDLKEYINERMGNKKPNVSSDNKKRRDPSIFEPTNDNISESDFVSGIKNLRELKQKGVISEEEFEKKKSDILERI